MCLIPGQGTRMWPKLKKSFKCILRDFLKNLTRLDPFFELAKSKEEGIMPSYHEKLSVITIKQSIHHAVGVRG